MSNQLPISISQTETPELGKKYPLFGMITKFLNDELGSVIVEVNNNITCNMVIHSQEHLNTLKKRCFEPAIFVSVVTNIEPTLVVDCVTVIFGRQQNKEIN
jgi:hypothetical protein